VLTNRRANRRPRSERTQDWQSPCSAWLPCPTGPWIRTAHPSAYGVGPDDPQMATDQRFRCSGRVWSPPPESNPATPSLPWIGGQAPCYPAFLQVARHRRRLSYGATTSPCGRPLRHCMFWIWRPWQPAAEKPRQSVTDPVVTTFSTLLKAGAAGGRLRGRPYARRGRTASRVLRSWPSWDASRRTRVRTGWWCGHRRWCRPAPLPAAR
jgi:hypothetical protein